MQYSYPFLLFLNFQKIKFYLILNLQLIVAKVLCNLHDITLIKNNIILNGVFDIL